MPPPPADARVVLLTPSVADAAVSGEALGRAGISSAVCTDSSCLLKMLDEGAGALVVAVDRVDRATVDALRGWLERQPPWSDLPIVALAPRLDGATAHRAFAALPNVVLLERPVRLATLASALKAALRSRQRQYEARAWIEEQARQEAALLQTQKLESIGLLAGGIAHDFNNLLTAILGNAMLAEKQCAPDHPARPSIARVIAGTERAAQLTHQLLAYAGRARVSRENVHVGELAAELGELLTASIPRTVELSVRIAEDAPPIVADEAQMQQLLMNLVLNAAEAVGEQGHVVVGAEAAHVGAEPIDGWMPHPPRPGRHLRIVVEDDGIGMDEDTRQKIFDPFFTTKFTGRGLGLAAVLGIVRAHEGAVRAESEPGRGTRFEVLLPTADDHPAAGPRAPDEVGGLEGVRVLVVDDDATVRELAVAVLEEAGCAVRACNDGSEAVRAVTEQPDAFDVVLLDLMMPVMGGAEALAALRRIRADLPVVACSGYDEDDTLQRIGGDRLTTFVAKPFRPDHLLSAVASAARSAWETP